jgi:AraC family transcriptional regulator, chitin signaling transcriptional activator
MVGALITIKLRYLGVLHWNWFIEYILNYTIVIDSIAMSLAISYKLSDLKAQKELAIQNKLIEEKLKTENELMILKNQTLESEIIFQNYELSNFAIHSIQKKEFLNTLKKELEQIAQEVPGQSALKKLIKNIDKENEEDSHWDEFQLNFDKAHHNFLTQLKEDYPSLKPGDLLLCAYIKLGKANKEIAALLSITVSGVEKKRMRLKEKLFLDHEKSLSAFILNRK